MKKGLLALTSVALTGCMLLCFAGCGAASKAKSIRGEEVTEDVWNSAMAGTAVSSQNSASLPVATVADETVQAPNFKVEYEMRYKMDASTEEVSVGDTQVVEAGSASIDMSMQATLVVADNAVHITLSYDFKLDGSDNLLSSMDLEKGLAGSGKAEAYISYANGMTILIKDDAGNWVNATLNSDTIAEAVKMVIESSTEMADQSALVGDFADYQYSADQKGYVIADASAQVSAGESAFAVAGSAVYKIKDNKLAAIYAEASMDMNLIGVSTKGSSQMGLVYTYGGQSVTVPTVS